MKLTIVVFEIYGRRHELKYPDRTDKEIAADLAGITQGEPYVVRSVEEYELKSVRAYLNVDNEIPA